MDHGVHITSEYVSQTNFENAEAEDVDIVPLLFARGDGRAHLGLLELVVGYLHALY